MHRQVAMVIDLFPCVFTYPKKPVSNFPLIHLGTTTHWPWPLSWINPSSNADPHRQHLSSCVSVGQFIRDSGLWYGFIGRSSNLVQRFVERLPIRYDARRNVAPRDFTTSLDARETRVCPFSWFRVCVGIRQCSN
jgi:hypothetical protein